MFLIETKRFFLFVLTLSLKIIVQHISHWMMKSLGKI